MDNKTQPELEGLLFVMIGREAFLDKRLDQNDILVYVSLCSFMDNQTRTSFPAIPKIAERARLSNREVSYCLKKLIEHDYVLKKRRPNQSSLYKITSKGFFTEDNENWFKKAVKKTEQKPAQSEQPPKQIPQPVGQESGYAHNALPVEQTLGTAHHALPELHTMRTNYTHTNYIELFCSELRFSEIETKKIVKIAADEKAELETVKHVLTEFDQQDKSKIKRPFGWIRNRIREIHIEETLKARPQTEAPAEAKEQKPLVVIVKDERRNESAKDKDKPKENKYEKFYL